MEIWLANLVYWECMPCSNHCSQRTDGCAFGMKVTHIEAMLFKSLLEPFFLPRFCCHLLDSATVFWKWVGLWCPFAFAVLPHLIYSSRRLRVHQAWADDWLNKKGLASASGVLIYVRRICAQFWLVLETRNVMSGLPFWRHCGYEVYWIQIKYFIVSLLCDENFWNMVHTLHLSKEAIAHFFRFFLWLLMISPNFQGTFLRMSFFSRTAWWIILKFGHELCLTSAHQFR